MDKGKSEVNVTVQPKASTGSVFVALAALMVAFSALLTVKVEVRNNKD